MKSNLLKIKTSLDLETKPEPMKRLSIIIFIIVTLLVFILELTGNSRVNSRKEQFEIKKDTTESVVPVENLNTTRRAAKLALK